MRIERIAIRGFGALANVDVPWPEGRLLLVVDPNETGKTTLCEALVAALYGLPRGRVTEARARERRRPRGGAPLAVAVDVAAAGRHLTASRNLEKGTLAVRDRDRGADVTGEFARGAARDVFGESVTGLSEPLFRTTAYVAQNVLDADELSRGLTLELARIADSGGGEASVIRAIDAIEAASARMPEALSGPTVSLGTEIQRLGKRIEEKRAELAKRREVREGVRSAAADLVARAAAVAERERRVALLEAATVEAERRQVAGRLEELEESGRMRGALEEEAARLREEAGGFTAEILLELDRLERLRGQRPAALARARAELADATRRDDAEAASVRQDLGAVAALSPDERRRLDSLLAELESAREEEAAAGDAVSASWQELEAEGVAEDLRRLEELTGPEREFLAGSEEERHALEMEGVKCDRRAAEAQATAALVVGERRGLVKRGRGLLILSGLALAVSFGLLASRTAPPLGLGFLASGAIVATAGGLVWWRGSRHLLGEERRRREEEAAARRQAADVRRRLSEVRSRVDRIARGAGYGEGPALARALRRLRSAETRRASLVGRTARRDAARERIARLGEAMAPFAAILVDVPPSPERARELRQSLAQGERAFQERDAREAAHAAERERLARDESELHALEAQLVALLVRAGVPKLLPLPEALRLSEGARERLARRREVLEVELPARAAPQAGVREELTARLARLAGERDRRLRELAVALSALETFATPEEARRAAEGARRDARTAEEVRRRAERTVAARMKEGGERARETEESLHDLEEGQARAVGFREALAEAREALAQAAARAYADFREGLGAASREILASWDVPFVALEFDDALSVSVVLRDGRRAVPEEIASTFSTGAREQIHLTARLAALRYLGTGARGVPLLLDDPLVAADDERFVSVMRFLVRHVLSERPVLVVSCHGWRHEALLARLEPEERELVARASLRPSSSSIDAPGTPD